MAAILNVRERNVVRMFKDRVIRAWQINGKLWRTKREIVDAWITRQMRAVAL